MLKIRLKRAGGRNRPFYRVVVIDSRKARDSRALEEIGYYNPLEKPLLINVDRERVDYWKERGAQVSDSVNTLLKRENAFHPARRTVESFAPAPPIEIETRTKKKLKGKGVKAAVATEEDPVVETKATDAEAPAAATEATDAEAPAADTEEKAETKPADEATIKTEE